MLFLPALLANQVVSSTSPLIIVSDSLLQPGGRLFRQFIHDAVLRDEHIVLVALEQTPSRLLGQSHRGDLIDLIDCTSGSSETSNSTYHSSISIDIQDQTALSRLINATKAAVLSALESGKKVTVVLDSLNVLAEDGVQAVFSFIKKSLDVLSTRSGCRLLALHHSDFPILVSKGNSKTSPALLASLLTPSLSSNTVIMTLHPCALLEALSRDYGLSIPLTSGSPLDVRLYSFLSSFTSRHWGSPFVRPLSATAEDDRIPLDIGGMSSEGKSIVEWSSRGVECSTKSNTSRTIATLDKRQENGASKKVISRGVEGLKCTKTGVGFVELEVVLNPERMASVHVPVISSVASSSKADDNPLSFNLSLTDSQKAAREQVVLPYVPKDLKAAASAGGGMYAGGGIEYAVDEGDDMDDDDPDEDLEV